jgi:hypothetical protein
MRAALFGPLGIEAVRWQVSAQGITLGFGGFWMTTRDLANPLGLDGVLRDVVVEHLGPLADQDRMAATAVWRDAHTLVMRWYSFNNPEYWTVEFMIEGERADLRWEDALSGHGGTATAQ